MRISPIATQITVSKFNIKSIKNNPTTNPQINFKSSAYEDEVERETQSKRDNYNWFEWNVLGKKEKEINNAKAKIDKRNHDNEIARVEAETLNKVNQERMEDLRGYTNRLEEQQRKNDELLAEFKKSHEETILIQKKALETQSQAAESLKGQLQDYQRIMREIL